jgi:uncharacterized protein YkwD
MFATALLCAGTLLFAADPAVAPRQETPSGESRLELLAIEQNIIAFTNYERARYGQPLLEVDPELMDSARQHTVWMTVNQSMVHSRQPVAENIAMGQRDSEEVVQSWMHSTGHRANILNSSNHRIGVAAYRTASGTIFWCQQFRR